jgi:hypothetical protein
MHDTSIENATAFFLTHSIPIKTILGKKGARCRGLESKYGMTSINIVFEEGELPVLGIHYEGNEGQFITERFTDKSFPEVSGAFQEALSGIKRLRTRSEKTSYLDSLIDEYSIRLTELYCGVLKRRWMALHKAGIEFK